MMKRLLAFAVLLLVGCGAETNEAVPAFPRLSDVTAIIDRSENIVLSAYTLAPTAVFRHLQAAAARGAHVHLVLTDAGFDYALEQNCNIAHMLVRAPSCAPGTYRRRGAAVTLTNYPLHMKALVADGVTIVTDTNFQNRGLYVLLQPEMRRTVLKAIAGEPGYYGPFTTRKDASLRVEAAMLHASTAPIVVETESFSAGNPVFDTLRIAARSHRSVTLIANAKDANESASFEDARQRLTAKDSPYLPGPTIDIRLVNATEKIAVAGAHCWAGSSNASGGLSEQIDWGLRIDDETVCKALLQRALSNR